MEFNEENKDTLLDVNNDEEDPGCPPSKINASSFFLSVVADSKPAALDPMLCSSSLLLEEDEATSLVPSKEASLDDDVFIFSEGWFWPSVFVGILWS